MQSNLVSITLAVLLACGSFQQALAGWHHRHQCCYAAPTYYSAPAAAPPQAAVNPLVEALIPVFADLIRSRLSGQFGNQINQGSNQGQGNQNQGSNQTQGSSSDLTSLKTELEKLAAGVENTNSTLRRHGEELTNLRLDVAAIKEDVTTIKTLVGANGTLQTDLKDVLAKLPKLTRTELASALTSNEFFSAVNAQTRLTAPQRKALIDELTRQVNETLGKHYGN